MQVIVQSMLASVVFLLIPFLLGDVIFESECIIEKYIRGFLLCMAIVQTVGLPAIFMRWKLNTFIIFSGMVFVVVLIAGLIYSKKSLHHLYIYSLRKRKIILPKDLFFVLFGIVLLIQLIRVFRGAFFVFADNTVYVPYINDMVETGKIYPYDTILGQPIPPNESVGIKHMFTTYFLFLASISRISGLHTLLLTQTVLPILLTIIFYATTWLFSSILFDNTKGRFRFLFFVSLIIEFSGGFDYTLANHVLAGIYFGKKIVFTIFIPYLYCYVAKLCGIYSKKTRNLSWKEVLLIMIFTWGTCSMSLMAAGLVPIVLLILGVVLLFRCKSPIPLGQMVIASLPALVLALSTVCYVVVR